MTNAETCTAISITRPGGPDVLQAVQRPRPVPGATEVLIRVEAAGVNRPDILQRLGVYPPPKGASPDPGLEIAGTVEQTGADVRRWRRGDKVCALVNGGGYASCCMAEESQTLPVPDGLTMIEAAALPETTFTVWSNVFERTGLKSGETLLVHGGASGIGTMAIQMAAAMGATVIATASSDKKMALCKSLGARTAINYQQEDFVTAVKEVTGGRGADVILDMVGGDYIERNFAAAAADGRIALIGFMGGASAEVNFTRLLIKRLTLTGSTLRARSAEAKAEIAAAVEKNVWPLINEGRVKPFIFRTFPLDEAAQAHALMESGDFMGKIILTVEEQTVTPE